MSPARRRVSRAACSTSCGPAPVLLDRGRARDLGPVDRDPCRDVEAAVALRQLVGRHEPRTERDREVLALRRPEPDGHLLALDVARAPVVEQREAGDRAVRRRGPRRSRARSRASASRPGGARARRGRGSTPGWRSRRPAPRTRRAARRRRGGATRPRHGPRRRRSRARWAARAPARAARHRPPRDRAPASSRPSPRSQSSIVGARSSTIRSPSSRPTRGGPSGARNVTSRTARQVSRRPARGTT